jgi:hypothetical protein
MKCEMKSYRSVENDKILLGGLNDFRMIYGNWGRVQPSVICVHLVCGNIIHPDCVLLRILKLPGRALI